MIKNAYCTEKVMISDEADEVIEEIFKSHENKYQYNLESMKGTEFVFDYVHLLYHKCHKINPNHRGSYTKHIKNRSKSHQ